MWKDYGKSVETSHLAYSILLPQLIATLIHYPCTVALPGLAAWSAFSKAGFLVQQLNYCISLLQSALYITE